MNAGIPERILVDVAPDLKFRVESSWDLECVYKCIRAADSVIADCDSDEYYMCRGQQIDYMEHWHGDRTLLGKSGIMVKIWNKKNGRDWGDENKNTVSMSVSLTADTGCGFRFPVTLIYAVDYVNVVKERESDREEGKKYLDLEFYNARGERVITLSQYKGWTFRSKAGTYALTMAGREYLDSEKKERKAKEFDGGCLFCNYATYLKENGIIYLKCTKYDGMVKETEYEGTSYPEYCRRR